LRAYSCVVIWFLRHGDAAAGSPDFERPLTPKGERQSHDAGATLAALGVEFDLCLSSPRVRARDTARLACESLGVEVTIEDRLAGGRFDPLELAAGLGDVLLVGHEPDFSNAIAELTGGRVDLKKGGVAAVDDGELRVLLRPKDTNLIATVHKA
jgi:phosphohistidine phosphatase